MIYNYPYTSMQEMNLDWLIKITKESKDILDSVHSEIKELFTEWINANYDKLILNVSYVDDKQEIIFYHNNDSKKETMNINQLI